MQVTEQKRCPVHSATVKHQTNTQLQAAVPACVRWAPQPQPQFQPQVLQKMEGPWEHSPRTRPCLWCMSAVGKSWGMSRWGSLCSSRPLLKAHRLSSVGGAEAEHQPTIAAIIPDHGRHPAEATQPSSKEFMFIPGFTCLSWEAPKKNGFGDFLCTGKTTLLCLTGTPLAIAGQNMAAHNPSAGGHSFCLQP